VTTSELERRLTAVLKQHAEDAMNSTHTEEQLEILQTDAEQERRRRRRNWAAGGLAVAAATVGLVLWASNLEGAETDTAVPAQQPSAEEVATSFLDSYASFDRAEASSYLADDAFLDIWSGPGGVEAWREGNRWFEAIGFKMLNESCMEQGTSSAGTQVRCTYDFHAIRSEELGRGPFSGSVFTFAIRDGEVVSADQELEFLGNGFSEQMWEPFAAWVSRTHPEDAAIMYADWPSQRLESLTPRSIELWEKQTKNYVDAQG
jgi:hypothetical protein